MSDVSSATSATTTTFETALAFNAIVFGIELAAFTLLRPYFKQIYEPRSVTLLDGERVKPFKAAMFTWPLAILKADYRDIQRVNGPDAYLFVRFLRMMIRILVPIWIISWIVLLPVTSVNNSATGKTGLDRFIFGNVSPYNQNRYAAHIVCVYLFTFWIYWNIRREMYHFLTVRQLHLIDPVHSRSAQANTILVTGIPEKYLSESALCQLYSHLPGGVKKVWLNRDLKELPAVYDRRLAICGKLESAEAALLSTAAKLRAKSLKKAAKQADHGYELDAADAERDTSLAERLVPRNKRPTHRLPVGFLPFSLPFIGEKVDTIEWCRNEIVATTVLLRHGRHTIMEQSSLPIPEDINGDGKIDKKDLPHQNYPLLNSAFITFNQQISAHMAYRTLAHHEPYRMADRYLEVAPEDVLWGSLGMNPYEKRVRKVLSYAATAALIIFWAIPVAFVGIISNIQGLCTRASWLAWLCKIPPVVLGIIQGILPPVLLAVLMMLLPIVLRLFARFEGVPTRTGLELSLMTRYFIFQVIHSFLIVTLSSGIVAALPSLLQNPSSIATLLAQYLPQASTFFLTYIILQGLSGAAGGFLAAVQLVVYYVKLVLLGSTPRSVFNIKFGPRTVAWGTLFPSITLLTVITLGYSIISPIINGLAVLAFFLFYQLYKYLFLYQYTQPAATDTGGLFFPKALQHVFVGLYVQQLCLCALFFLARDSQGKPSAVPEGVLMVVLIALTAGYHLVLNESFNPLISALPLSIADKTHKSPEYVGEGTSLGEKRHTVDSAFSSTPIVAKPAQRLSDSSSCQDVSPSTSKAEGDVAQRLDDAYFYKHEDGVVDYGFAHPAVSRPQRVVWIAQDVGLGLGKEEVRANREAGVKATVENAKMDGRGKVDVTGPPVDLNKF